jgi:hypothetical protein
LLRYSPGFTGDPGAVSGPIPGGQLDRPGRDQRPLGGGIVWQKAVTTAATATALYEGQLLRAHNLLVLRSLLRSLHGVPGLVDPRVLGGCPGKKSYALAQANEGCVIEQERPRSGQSCLGCAPFHSNDLAPKMRIHAATLLY